MPDRMPNRMSEDISDRMPEDVPVRLCINVMVGITRSKVICISCFFFVWCCFRVFVLLYVFLFGGLPLFVVCFDAIGLSLDCVEVLNRSLFWPFDGPALACTNSLSASTSLLNDLAEALVRWLLTRLHRVQIMSSPEVSPSYCIKVLGNRNVQLCVAQRRSCVR